MNPSLRPLALAALAAGQAGTAHAAAAITPTLGPGFTCNSATEPAAGGTVTWQGVSIVDSPTIGYLGKLGEYNGESKIDCAGNKLSEAVARKSGEGQKDFIKVTMKEVYVTSLRPGTDDTDFKWRATQVLGSLGGDAVYETYFEVLRQFEPATGGAGSLDTFLGFKFVTSQKFTGLDEVKFEFKLISPVVLNGLTNGTDGTYGLLTFTAPTQDEDGVTMSLTAAPNDVPEPGTLVLLGTGLLGAAAVRRRRRGW